MGACAKDIFARNTFAKGTWSEDICIRSAYIGDVCISIRNLISWNGCIHSFANSSCRFTAVDLTLLVDSKLVIFISF